MIAQGPQLQAPAPHRRRAGDGARRHRAGGDPQPDRGRSAATLGMGVLFITHDLGVIARIADSVNVMYGGRIDRVRKRRRCAHPQLAPIPRGLVAATPRIDVDERPAFDPGASPASPSAPWDASSAPDARTRCRSARPSLRSRRYAQRRTNCTAPPAGHWTRSGHLPLRVVKAAPEPVAAEVAAVAARPAPSSPSATSRWSSEYAAGEKSTLARERGLARSARGRDAPGSSASPDRARARSHVRWSASCGSSKGVIKHGSDTLRDLLRRKDRTWRKRVQMVFQDPYASLDPAMAVGQVDRRGHPRARARSARLGRRAGWRKLLTAVEARSIGREANTRASSPAGSDSGWRSHERSRSSPT